MYGVRYLYIIFINYKFLFNAQYFISLTKQSLTSIFIIYIYIYMYVYIYSFLYLTYVSDITRVKHRIYV